MRDPTPLAVAAALLHRAGHQDHSNERGHWPSPSIMTNGSDAYRAKPEDERYVDVDAEIREFLEEPS